MGEKSERARMIEPIDDDSSSGLHELLDLLESESDGSSLLEDHAILEILNDSDKSAHSDEYVLPPSAWNETNSLEELADLATGSYKVVDLEMDSPECYFHFTRSLEALKEDPVASEEIKAHSPAYRNRRSR